MINNENFLQGKGSDWDKGHNVYCLLDATFTDKTVVEEIAKFFKRKQDWQGSN
ncbi:hypothetical protein Hanom_Chr12g01128391 [Helianthus anomalus]